MAKNLTKKEFAIAMNASDDEIRKWRAEGMPRNADGTYDLEACQRWHLIGYWEQRNDKDVQASSKTKIKKSIDRVKPCFNRAKAHGLPAECGYFLAGMAFTKVVNGVSTDQVFNYFKEGKKLW